MYPCYSTNARILLAVCCNRHRLQTRTDDTFSHGKISVFGMDTDKSPFDQNVRFRTNRTYAQTTFGHEVEGSAVPVRYMGMADLRRVIVQLSSGILKQCRGEYFHPIHPASDPTEKQNIAFHSFTDKLELFPTKIIASTPPPVSAGHARWYHDGDK